MLFAPGSSQTRVLIVLRKPRDWSPPKRGFFFPTPIVRVPGRKAGQLSMTWEASRSWHRGASSLMRG